MIQETLTLKKGANYLPRGGYLVPTSVGYIQFGSPPETIKDTMGLPQKVPKIFVLPGRLFHVEKGIAVAELEFPIYFNHFLCKEKTLIICTKEQERNLKIVLNESVFGPSEINLESEFPNGRDSIHYPDLKAEIDYFRGNREMEDLVEFGVYDNNNCYTIDDVKIQMKENISYELYDHEEKIAEIPWEVPYQIRYSIGERLREPFEAPEFGITCLGPSHGFDPEDNTSGFILWINRRGIMIDPPVNSTEWLRQSNVNPKLIHHVILTHCHADHDAGTFQKILEEFPVYIHTSETVMDSFMRKYTALTGLPQKQLYTLFQFQPILIGNSVFIEGAEFIFHYTLHSIPALGFSLFYRNQSFLYTSDHLNHPEALHKMKQLGIFPDGRYEFLKNFPWHLNIIYHEAGIPPLHTPISYLVSLDEEIQKKITVYHISKNDFPENSKLKLAKFGIENTLCPEIKETKFANAIEMLDVLTNIDLFEEFRPQKAREFLMIVEEEHFHRGEHIIRKGTKGDKFYIIVSGNIAVQGIETSAKKTYGKYEYFGEVSLVTNEMRTADVLAATDVYALTIKKDRFLNFIQGTDVEHNLRNLAKIRGVASWDVLSISKVFGGMTSHQKTQLETIMNYKKIKPRYKLVIENKPFDTAYIIISGHIELTQKRKPINKLLQKGDFVGHIFSLQKHQPSPFTAKSIGEVEAYSIHRAALSKFIQKNPGVYMRMIRSTAEIA